MHKSVVVNHIIFLVAQHSYSLSETTTATIRTIFTKMLSGVSVTIILYHWTISCLWAHIHYTINLLAQQLILVEARSNSGSDGTYPSGQDDDDDFFRGVTYPWV